MSDVSTGAPRAAVKPAAELVLDFNRGVFVGEVLRRHIERAGEKRRKNGELYQQTKDSYEITLARKGQRVTFQVQQNAHDGVNEGDIVRIEYEIGGSRLDALYFVTVKLVNRVKRGNGRASSSAGQAEFRDESDRVA